MPNQDVRIIYQDNGASIYSNQNKSTPGMKIMLYLNAIKIYKKKLS